MVDEGLALAAAEIARHTPEQWNKFLQELDVHAKKQAYAVLHASRDTLQTVQGVAREAAYLYDVLKDAAGTAERIRAGKNRGD